MANQRNWAKQAKNRHTASLVVRQHAGLPAGSKKLDSQPWTFRRSVLTGMSANVPVGGSNRNRGGHGKPKTAKAVQLADPFEEAQKRQRECSTE